MRNQMILAIKLLIAFLILVTFCGMAMAFPYQEGWPQQTNNDVSSSPAIGDIDNDGDLEVVVGSSDNRVYAWHHDGQLVDGWPQATGGSVVASPALADIDGDGYLEIVVGSRDYKVYVWRYNGEIVIGWPQKAGGDVRSSPAIGDIDNDGDLEIVIGTNSFSDNAWAWHHNGVLVTGWPKDIGYYVNSTPTLADLDGDNDLEIALLSMGSGDVCVLHHNGSPVSGWPIKIGTWYECNDAAIGDIDKDGDLEIVMAAGNKVYAWHHNGVLLKNWPVTLPVGQYFGTSSPTLADLDGDGNLEIIVSDFRYSTPGNYGVYVLHHDSSIAPGWPIAKSAYGNPVAVDLDADGDMEIIFGSDDYGKVYAFHHDGTPVAGFPLSTGDIINSTVAITDLDSDGDIELIVGSNDDKVHVWDLPNPYDSKKIEWGTYHHDVWRTGLYGFVPPSVIYGDVSGDGTVSAYDAVMALQYAVGLITLTDAQKEAADVNKSGTVTAYDAALILQYVVGLITTFPAESKADAPALNATSESELLAKAIKELEVIHLDDEQKQVVEQLKRLLNRQPSPAHTTLLQNYPNPFNPETWIPFQLALDANVILYIYNIHGQLVRVLSLGHIPAGSYLCKEQAAYWNGRDNTGQSVASGVYYYTLRAGDFTATRKMIVVK